MEKLKLLQNYVETQNNNELLWFNTSSFKQAKLQQELRRIFWMIEDATEEQILNEIERQINEQY